VIWGNREAEYFCAEDSTETMRDLPVGQHKGWWVLPSHVRQHTGSAWSRIFSRLESFGHRRPSKDQVEISISRIFYRAEGILRAMIVVFRWRVVFRTALLCLVNLVLKQ
jgi:hypothetical protein